MKKLKLEIMKKEWKIRKQEKTNYKERKKIWIKYIKIRFDGYTI